MPSWWLGLDWGTALGSSFSSNTGPCEGNVHRPPHKTFTKLRLARFHCCVFCVCAVLLFFFLCAAVRVCSPSRLLTDIYGPVCGVCRITFHRRGPGERCCFLSATWLSVVCSKQPCLPVSPPTSRPKPPPKLQRSPYCWQLSLPPPPPTPPPPPPASSFSQNSLPALPPPRPASIRRRYSIHRRRALITKQDYGPSLGTTCQGACSLSCSLSTAHTLQRRACLCVRAFFFLEGRWRLDFHRRRHSPNTCVRERVSFCLYMPPTPPPRSLSFIDTYLSNSFAINE